MTFLSEDPTIMAAALGLAAASFLMAMRVTQQGKYLYWAIGTVALIALLLVVEHFWVTDNERIERVVYDLRQAVLTSDVEGVLAHLTPDVEYVHQGSVLPGDATRALIRANLEHATFDFVHIQELQTSVGQQTRRGKAEFRVYAKGALQTSLATFNMGTANSSWSLGFEEAAPHVWKVNRITPMSLPQGTITSPIVGGRRGEFGRSRGERRGEGGGPGPSPRVGPGPVGRPRGVPFRPQRPGPERPVPFPTPSLTPSDRAS